MANNDVSTPNITTSYGTAGGTLGTLSRPTDDTTLNTDEFSPFGGILGADQGGINKPGTSGLPAADFGSGIGTDHSFTGAAGMHFSTTVVPPGTKPTDAVKDAADAVKDTIDDVKAAATTAAESVKAQTTDLVAQAKDQVADLAGQAKAQVSTLTAQATDKVKDTIGDQKAKAADGLTAITEAIRQSANTLEEKGQAPIAGAVTGFAGQVEGFASYLKDKSVDELASDVTAYAKQNPQMFIGGAFLLGIAIARFLKSSNRTASGYTNTVAPPTPNYSANLSSGSGYGNSTTTAGYQTTVPSGYGNSTL